MINSVIPILIILIEVVLLIAIKSNHLILVSQSGQLFFNFVQFILLYALVFEQLNSGSFLHAADCFVAALHTGEVGTVLRQLCQRREG